jgi:hypothetical protein
VRVNDEPGTEWLRQKDVVGRLRAGRRPDRVRVGDAGDCQPVHRLVVAQGVPTREQATRFPDLGGRSVEDAGDGGRRQ